MAGTRYLKSIIGIILLVVIVLNSSIATSKSPTEQKLYHQNNKTVYITDGGQPTLSIQQTSSIPGLTTFEETFNVTFYTDNKLSIADLNLTTSHKKEKGREDVTGAEWYILTNVSYESRENIYGDIEQNILISNITLAENITAEWNITPRPVRYGSIGGLQKWNITRINATPERVGIGFDRHLNLTGDVYPTNTIFFWNQTGITGFTPIIKYRYEWQPLDKKDLKKRKVGESIQLKVIYHKKAEVGEVNIQTIPSFYDFEIPEMTWWNTTWTAMYNNNIADGGRPYVMNLSISNNTVSFGNTTHLNVTCQQANCTDLRAILNNNTELPIWREINTSTNGTGYGLWNINITGNGSVQIYSNATGVPDVSNGTNVYSFFDHFDGTSLDSRWVQNDPGGSVSVSNSNAVLSPGGLGDWSYWRASNAQNTSIPLILKMYAKMSTSGDNHHQIGAGDYSTPSFAGNDNVIVGYHTWEKRFDTNNNSATSVTYWTNDFIEMTNVTVILNGTTARFYLNGTLRSTHTTNIPDAKLGAAMGLANPGASLTIDYFLISNYVEPEPMWATWGAQQNQTNPPTITSFSNNATMNESLTPRINMSAGINFNATASQTITTWTWYRDGVNQNNNFDNLSTSWDTLGVKNVSMTAANPNGTTAMKTWVVTVSDITNPWLVNETVEKPAIAQNAQNTIFANFTDDTNISSAIVRIQSPNLSEWNYTMSCTPALSTSTCTYTDTDTAALGTYNITRYWVTDGSSNTANISSSLSFIASSAPVINDWMNSITNNNTLSAVRANISVSITFNISAGGVTSYQWYKDSVLQSGQEQASYTTSWDTLGNKNITATAKNAYGTSLPTTWSVNITDITAPWLTTSSVTSTSLFVQAYPVTINAEFGDDTNTSSAKVRVQNQDGSQANWSMSCTGTVAANCSLTYTATANIGGYNILFFYPVDGSGNQRNITSNLGFTTTAPAQGGGSAPPDEETLKLSSGGATGGGSPPPPEETPTPTPTGTPASTELQFKNITTGATEPEALAIAKCLTESLVMKNECSGINYGVVVEPFNWWVAVGAFIGAFGVVMIQSIRGDIKRSIIKETILYGIITVGITAILVSVGFNAYILNYLLDSPKYLWTTINFGVTGIIIAAIGDSYYYRTGNKKYKLKTKSSIPFDI